MRFDGLADRPLQTTRAMLLGFPAALFSAGVATDIAYLRTEVIQWTNFSSWMITGAMVFVGVLLAWSLIALLFEWRGPARGSGLLLSILLAVTFVIGLVNAFQHSRDGWSSVGAIGLILSILCALLALVAAWIGTARAAGEGAR